MGNKKGSRHLTYSRVRVELLVQYKPEVPDPEKKDLFDRLQAQGYDLVTEASLAKFFQIKLADTTLRKARAYGKKLGEILLANPVTENFEVTKVERTIQIGTVAGYDVLEVGVVEEGERQTIFEPEGIILPPPGE